MSKHLCGYCEIGSHKGQIELMPPPHLRRDDGRGICVDVCLAIEISNLWRMGISTTGCCCGHGKVEPYIGVADADIPKMIAMGYKICPNETDPTREDGFYPKSIATPTPARCDELVTVAHRAKYISELEHQWRYYRSADSGFDPTKYEEQPLVTRQNAEEVIENLKNEAAEKDKLIQSLIDFDSEEVKRLEADNKRLRRELKNLVERFSYYADLARDGVPNIEDWAYTEGSSDIAKARAALGEVKS